MANYLPNDKKEALFAEYGANAKDTGSTEGQVALFTAKIAGLSDHLKENHKDHSSRRRLLTLVGKRRRLLRYYAKKDIVKYRALIEKLNIRK